MLISKAFNGLNYCIGKFYRSGGFVFLLLALNCPTTFASNLNQAENIRDEDSKLTTNLKIALDNSSLPLIDEVSKLYQAREYNLIWSDGTRYNDKAHDLVRVIQNVRKLGLNPADYDLEIIKYFIETTSADPITLSKSDVTFTHAYIKLASQITRDQFGDQFSDDYDLSNSYGLLDNETFLTEILNDDEVDEDNPKIIQEAYQDNESPYVRLLNALEKYRSLNDNFEPIILQKKSLAIGDASPEIIKIRNRLYDLGDYKENDFFNDTFDGQLAIAISDFQHRHGLEIDGVLGKRTVHEINKSVEFRARQIELNLERAKQISELEDNRYILINVPEYKLYVIENGKSIYQTRVIVGKKKNKTPVLSSEISELVLNPYWNVPASITKDEIIPKLHEDPDYLAKNNMKVISRINNQNVFVDPEVIDWNSIDTNVAPFRIRQDPGKKNALGRVKFIFPNHYKVYLHDTPTKNLFTRNSRAFSHGCVRVENPFELAELLLSKSERWTKDDLYYFAQRKKTKTLKLDKPIPIHITYMTAWVDEQGIINFRPDIYKQDSHIAHTLYNAAL